MWFDSSACREAGLESYDGRYRHEQNHADVLKVRAQIQAGRGRIAKALVAVQAKYE
jgi:hypothetical protein